MGLSDSFGWWSDVLTGAGLFLTAIGAGLTAKSVLLSEDDAITIGVARYASSTREKNLNLPAVQNLLQASKGARRGLWVVVTGTALQIAPVIVRVAAPFI